MGITRMNAADAIIRVNPADVSKLLASLTDDLVDDDFTFVELTIGDDKIVDFVREMMKKRAPGMMLHGVSARSFETFAAICC